jgi:hypothetical protein
MGCFEIHRASIAPPSHLLSLIWPKLDAWKDPFRPNDLVAEGLINLLLYLREVILQDSVILRERFPNSPIWNHPVFQHKAYEWFYARIRDAVSPSVEGEQPNKLALLTQVMPELADPPVVC